jgi:hypothetical protein
VYTDYWQVLQSLQARNSEKVRALHNAYVAFGVAVLAIALGTAYVCLVSI